ncbi:MAG: hypothetical protein DRI36_02295 [Caldiserica bacterium]|nr:MAG: hypothetical protein DRI36_02295 [Caldisericota bacterium]
MYGKDHKRVAEEISKKLNLSDKEKNALLKGIIEPDITRGRGEAHHYRKKYKIFDEIIRAKRYFNQGERIKACYHLGKALHFIQDSLITAGGKHDFIEERISSYKFYLPEPEELSLKEVYSLIKEMRKYDEIKRIVDEILRISILISYNVLRKHKFDDVGGYKRSKIYFLLRTAGLILLPISFFTSYILLIPSIILIIIFSTSPSYIDYKIWYNI